MTLRELEIGDKFIHAKDKRKNPKRFVVSGTVRFNLRAGQATRECYEADTGTGCNKMCLLEVRKIGVSTHKEKLLHRAGLK
jgi:hypothetical protein